jgi:hypothetical protein
MRSMHRILVAAFVIGLVPGCLNTPTIPVPPPFDATKIFPLTAPNENGLVLVHGEPHAGPTWEQVSGVRAWVKNLDTGEWKSEYLNEDGSFDVWIFAESGHTIEVRAWYPYGGLSEADPVLTVP